MKRALNPQNTCNLSFDWKYTFLILVILLSCTFLSAQYDPFSRITDDSYTEGDLVMEGDYIVYTMKHALTSEYSIVLYTISTKETLEIASPGHEDFSCLDISGDRIVWQQKENGEWDIYNYLISRPDIGAYPLIDLDGDQNAPAIHEDYLVWVQGDGTNSSIVLYTISTAEIKQITEPGEVSCADPDVFGGYVVWSDRRYGNADIFLYKTGLDEEVRVTDNEAHQVHPSIYGRTVVWEDYRNYNADIYLYYIDALNPIDPPRLNYPVFSAGIGYMNSWDQRNPIVGENFIVYEDNRNYNWDIYYSTFINPIVTYCQPLINEVGSQKNPYVCGNRIIWEDDREHTFTSPYYFNDIWMWEKPPGVDLAVNIMDNPNPVASGADLEYLCLVSNSGNQSAIHPHFTFDLPAEVDLLSVDGFNSEGYTRVDNTLSFYLDSVERNSVDTVIIQVRPLIETILSASSTVEADEEDIDLANNYTSCETKVVWLLPSLIDEGGQASIAADRLGNPHFVYLSDMWGGMLKYARIVGNSPVSLILDSSDYCSSPAIAVDHNNRVHIAYAKKEDEMSMDRGLYYLTNKDGIWSEQEVIDENVGDGMNICIRIDKENNLHVSCMTSLWSYGSTNYYIKEETWSKVHAISGTYNFASFDLDTASYAHFTFYDLARGGLCYKTNSPDGTWSEVTNPDDDWQGGQMETLVCDIAVDSQANPHISYVATSDEFSGEDYQYIENTSGTWTQHFLEEGDFMGAENNIDIGPDGDPHICFFNPVSRRIRYMWKEEETWHKKTIAYPDIYSNPGVRSQDLFVDSYSNMHLVYYSEDKIHYVTNREPIPEPVISVSPDELDFLEHNVDDTTDARKVTIGNVGEGDLLIDDIRVIWPDSADFYISRSSCSLLHPGDTCSVDIHFTPGSIGSKHALLWIESNDPVNPTEGVSLKGVGLKAYLVVYGSSLFGDVELGDSAVNVFTLKNEGNTYLIIQDINLQQGDVSDFYISGLDETYFRIDEGDSVQFSVVFKPQTEGEKAIRLKVFSTASDPGRDLTGRGIIPSYTVGGEIRLPGNELVREGWIYIRNMGVSPPDFNIYYKPLEGAESFEFISVPPSTVTLYFNPDETANPGYIRTYLGNKAFLEDAETMELNQDRDDILITLLEAPEEKSGNNSASGTLSEGTKKHFSISIQNNGGIAEGNPLEDVPVYLLDIDGAICYHDVTDAEGKFGFEKIEGGSYMFKADYLGIPMNEDNDTLVISGENEEYGIVAVVGAESIGADIEKLSGLEEHTVITKLRIYPNPFRDVVFVTWESLPGAELNIEIIEITGRSVMDYRVNAAVDREGEIEISTGNLEAGQYTIVIQVNGSRYVNRMIKF